MRLNCRLGLSRKASFTGTKNLFLRVIDKHRRSAYRLDTRALEAALYAWRGDASEVETRLRLATLGLGLFGMPRRVYTYDSDVGWGGYNMASTIGGFGLGAGVLLFVVGAWRSLRTGPAAPNASIGSSTVIAR